MFRNIVANLFFLRMIVANLICIIPTQLITRPRAGLKGRSRGGSGGDGAGEEVKAVVAASILDVVLVCPLGDSTTRTKNSCCMCSVT
jgi:hypothetical protein